MKNFKKILIYIYCLPRDIFHWLILLLFWSLWGENLRWQRGLWFDFKKGSWPMRTWYKNWAGTTLGHGGWYSPNPKEPTIYHESRHTKQSEAYFLKTIFLFLYFCIVFILSGNIILSMATAAIFDGLIPWIPNWIHAWLSNLPIYKGSIHEEAAYGLTELWIENEKRRLLKSR